MDDFIPIGELTNEKWNQIIAVNLTGPMYSTRKAVQVFQKQGNGGNIINVASIGGLCGGRAGTAYTSSKHAMIGMSKNTAYMYAAEKIRCNVIAPGGVETEIGVGCSNPSKFGYSRMALGISLTPRMGTSMEIAKIALFLASDESSLLNGAILTADAGLTAY